MPQASVPTSWYRDAWPNLVETLAADASIASASWTPSDWDREVPGSVPPVWPSPWDRPALKRDGTLADRPDHHSLSELSPLHTITMLQCAGIVPAGEAGSDSYRHDRSPKRPWNDRHGNPLIVVCSTFIPPRYDFTPEENESARLKGGRDYLLKKAKTLYGCNSAVYVAVAAVSDATDLVPAHWSPADDAVVLRRLWLRVRETCGTGVWNETSFTQPPWKGTKRAKRAGGVCFITFPEAFR
ncbi:MAG: hypothetical protein H0V44_09205 [Planctomycetes bacterium]|nr:hypothetical protein [Planctomycetota bacterium]